MAVESYEDRLQEFGGEKLLCATTIFDGWCHFLYQINAQMHVRPGQYTDSILMARDQTCAAFNTLADIIITDFKLGDLQDRLTALATIKVGAEHERHGKFKSGKLLDTSDHHEVIERDVQHYLGLSCEFSSDRELCSVVQADFAQNLANDIANYRTARLAPSVLPRRSGQVGQTEKDQSQRWSRFAAMSALGLGVTAAVFYLKASQKKA